MQRSQQLLSEFYLYVILSRCLNKAFLSIKGIYYQVLILGVPITWAQPYKFVQKVSSDVGTCRSHSTSTTTS